MKIAVIDIETTMKGPLEMRASPYVHENRIVAIGYKLLKNWDDIGAMTQLVYIHKHGEVSGYPSADPFTVVNDLLTADLWVGHNLGGFDLPWLRIWMDGLSFGSLQKKLGIDIKIWDTQIVEYLLSGQLHRMPSLNEVSAKYGGTLKETAIADAWNEGIDTEDIKVEDLLQYLIEDVNNTTKVFQAQIREVAKNNMFRFIETQMMGRLATAEMEWNGLAFDHAKATEHSNTLKATQETLLHDLMATANGYIQSHTKSNVILFNPDSPKQIKTILFGGTFKEKVDMPVLDDTGIPIQYKTGKRRGMIKTKQTDVEYTVPAWTHGMLNVYSDDTSEDNLEKITTDPGVKPDCKVFITKLLAYRGVVKQLNTYYEGYGKFAIKKNPDDSISFIHSSYNHCVTRTGRLSSSKPNLQNINGKENFDDA